VTQVRVRATALTVPAGADLAQRAGAGTTRRILHAGGVSASLLQCIRCIDPVPVWGVLPYG
jgi:hypothetical protein